MFEYNELKLVNIIATSIVMLFSLCGFGCAGDYIEYTTLDPALVSKKIHFKKPMVYFVFADKQIAKKYGFIYPKFENKKIIRDLVSKYTANDLLSYIPNLQVEPVKEGMTFTIVGKYWVRHSLLKRQFAPEYQKLILRDGHNIYSVYMVSGDNIIESLMPNTDFGDH